MSKRSVRSLIAIAAALLSVVCDRLITNGSRAGTLELQRPGPDQAIRNYRSLGAARSARNRPSHAFRLKQDGQDVQDSQDGQKVWKTLMSIDASEQPGEKVREDLNLSRRAASL